VEHHGVAVGHGDTAELDVYAEKIAAQRCDHSPSLPLTTS
jgi:hypothetical protein